MRNRSYRFFYHFNKQANKMSVHYRGKCHIVDNVICERAAETKWSLYQPHLVMRGFCKEVDIKNGIAIIK